MDSRVHEISGLTPTDLELLRRVKAGLPITADVSRADVLLCTLLKDDRALVAFHAVPHSISSLYHRETTGRLLTAEEQPLLFQALRNGSGGRRQREVLSNGAPVIQDVYPILGSNADVIGAMLVETNMIAHERQRRRSRYFRQAIAWLQEMCMRGELEGAEELGSFTIYDGLYLVDTERTIVYLSGIAANLFRSIGMIPEVRDQPLASLEDADIRLVEEVIATRRCKQVRLETEDGRVWVRMGLPIRMPTFRWRNYWLTMPWDWVVGGVGSRSPEGVDAVMVIMHNATEAVQKERELNVKSAIIQEVHHRVKNNLQNIAAILRIQARRVESEEARQHLTEAVNRVLSMSVIHEFLSQDEHRPINIKDVCQRIATQVAQVSGNPEQQITIEVEGSNIRLPASQATPVSMVVNELLLNAVEHGLQDRSLGHIRIVLDDLGDTVGITVEDDGAGLPPGFDPAHSTSLGLHIVHTLVTDDLKGQLRMESIRREEALEAGEQAFAGTRATVMFPKRALHGG